MHFFVLQDSAVPIVLCLLHLLLILLFLLLLHELLSLLSKILLAEVELLCYELARHRIKHYFLLELLLLYKLVPLQQLINCFLPVLLV